MDTMIIWDFLLVAGAAAMIFAPRWVYNFGKREKTEMPDNWPRKSRIIGAIFLAISLFFLFIQLR